MDQLAPTEDTFTEPMTEELLRLRELFPSAFVGDRVDLDTLAGLLGEHIIEGDGPYALTWHGKHQARKAAELPATGTLCPDPEQSVDCEGTANILIEGDNLEVLRLLQETHRDQVRMIYIDPPYNTGREFIYPDRYQESIGDYLRQTGQLDGKGAKPTDGAEISGRYHTRWLNMMYPRMSLARNLLREDGVIFVSIDDHEVHNLRLLMDEIFGPENFVTSICHKARASVSNDKVISENHNHILLYARDATVLNTRRHEFGLEPKLEGFNKTDERGAYKLVPVDGPGGAAKGNPHYEFLGVSGYFRFSKERMTRMHEEGLIVKTGDNLQQKKYRDEAEGKRRTTTTWWDENFYTSTATTDLKRLMGGKYFDSPKHPGLIRKMLQLASRDDGDIILDFFAGSGSTAHAIWEQGLADGVKRRFILVQLPEEIDPKSPAGEAGFRTITEVTAERLRKAGQAIDDHEGSDRGFRYLRLNH